MRAASEHKRMRGLVVSGAYYAPLSRLALSGGLAPSASTARLFNKKFSLSVKVPVASMQNVGFATTTDKGSTERGVKRSVMIYYKCLIIINMKHL